MFKLYYDNKKISSAMSLYEDLKADPNVIPDIKTFSILIETFSKMYELDIVAKLLEEMVGLRIFPAKFVQNAIYSLDEKSGELNEEAKEIIVQLKKELKKIVKNWPKEEKPKTKVPPLTEIE